jgi:membrane-bound lytic murein transglycosylase D
MMRQVLEKEGLPLDLVYLSMIESGFSAYAYSFARAAGPWQFVVGTSKRYGLVTDFWVDERRDPLKSTVAAAKYLRELRERFHGDWYLAWAGYNAGEGKISRAIRKEGTTDFWRMMGKGRTLRAETKHYVPKLIAAALIAKHPERFGFHVEYEQPQEVDEVSVPDATDLRVVAKAAGISFEQLHDLNPELRRFCTPPGGWTLKLPRGTREPFLAAYEKLAPAERLSFTEHRVERGEPLAKIARAYGVTEAAILRTNGIKSYRQISVGRLLVIPMAGASRGMLAGSQLEDKRRRGVQGRTLVAAASAPSVSGVTYTVQPGDSLWTIAAKFSTTVDKLKRLNGLTGRRARSLQVGQTISVRES